MSAHAEQVAATTRCRVAAVRRFGAFTTMELVARELAAVSRPGQFVMVTVPGGGHLLRRPISLYTARAGRLGLLIEARGAGSDRLCAVEIGEAVDVAGPLGTPFPTAGVTQRAARRRWYRLRAAAVPGRRARRERRPGHRRVRVP